MGFELLGLGSLTMTDLKTGAEYDFGDSIPLEIEQLEWSKDIEPSRTIKGFAESATFSCKPTIVDQDSFDELLRPSNSSEFTCEWDTPILVQTRWHKKARVCKKWLKRYGYKEDAIKTIAKAMQGEYNTETGECSIDIDSIKYILRPDQQRRGLDIKYTI